MEGVYAHVAPETRAALMAADERDWQAALQARYAISPISPVAVLDALLSSLRQPNSSKHSDPRSGCTEGVRSDRPGTAGSA